MKTITVEELAVEEGAFEVTFTGQTTESFIGKQPCVWYEWDFGEYDETKSADEFAWGTHVNVYTTELKLTGATRLGTLSFGWRKMRTYLAPTTLRVYTSDDAVEAPKIVRDWISEHGGPVTVAEYCLLPDKTYFAMVEGDTYKVPGEEEELETRTNFVLQISDVPFQEGAPPHAITPTYRGWKY